jgi:histidine triad (HIT) family protein
LNVQRGNIIVYYKRYVNQRVLSVSVEYNGHMEPNCIFCKIVSGEVPSHRVWEDEQHIAFLSIFPNTEGFTVVTTKTHYPSYAFDLPEHVLSALVLAARKVAKLLDAKLADVGRTAMVFEGEGVEHAHAKLIPMHGTKDPSWAPTGPRPTRYFETYPGYLSTHDGARADDAKLADLAKRIRG